MCVKFGAHSSFFGFFVFKVASFFHVIIGHINVFLIETVDIFADFPIGVTVGTQRPSLNTAPGLLLVPLAGSVGQDPFLLPVPAVR